MKQYDCGSMTIKELRKEIEIQSDNYLNGVPVVSTDQFDSLFVELNYKELKRSEQQSRVLDKVGLVLIVIGALAYLVFKMVGHYGNL